MWAPDYAEVDDLKSFIRIGEDDTVDDDELNLAIKSASRTIDFVQNRQYGNTGDFVKNYYTPYYSKNFGCWVVEVDDFMLETQGESGMVIKNKKNGDVTSNDDVICWPRDAPMKRMPYTHILLRTGTYSVSDDVEIDAVWGWNSVPETVKEACLLQANRFYARRFSPFGVAGSPDDGSEMRLLAKMDSDVALMLRPYYRWWGVA